MAATWLTVILTVAWATNTHPLERPMRRLVAWMEPGVAWRECQAGCYSDWPADVAGVSFEQQAWLPWTADESVWSVGAGSRRDRCGKRRLAKEQLGTLPAPAFDARDLGLLERPAYQDLHGRTTEVKRMLTGLSQRLRADR